MWEVKGASCSNHFLIPPGPGPVFTIDGHLTWLWVDQEHCFVLGNSDPWIPQTDSGSRHTVSLHQSPGQEQPLKLQVPGKTSVGTCCSFYIVSSSAMGTLMPWGPQSVTELPTAQVDQRHSACMGPT